MLRITQKAIQRLQHMRDRRGLPDNYAVRIYPQADGTNCGHSVAMTFCTRPGAADTLVQREGTDFYVHPDASAALTGAVIDVAPCNLDDRDLLIRQSAP